MYLCIWWVQGWIVVLHLCEMGHWRLSNSIVRHPPKVEPIEFQEDSQPNIRPLGTILLWTPKMWPPKFRCSLKLTSSNDGMVFVEVRILPIVIFPGNVPWNFPNCRWSRLENEISPPHPKKKFHSSKVLRFLFTFLQKDAYRPRICQKRRPKYAHIQWKFKAEETPPLKKRKKKRKNRVISKRNFKNKIK